MIFTSARFRKRISPLLRGLPREHPGLPQHRGWGIRGRKGTEGGGAPVGSGEEAGMAVSPPEAGCLEGSPLCVAASAQLEENVCILS